MGDRRDSPGSSTIARLHLNTERPGASRRAAPPHVAAVRRAVLQRRHREHAVNVARRIGVEADQLTAVVDAVDRRRADAVRVVDGRQAETGHPDESERLRGGAGADRVLTDDLVAVVDPERLRRARAGNRQRDVSAVGEQQVGDGRAGAVGTEAGDITEVVDPGARQVRQSGDVDAAVPAVGDVVGVAMIGAGAVGVEPDRDAMVVDAQQLVDLRLGMAVRREVDGPEVVLVDRVEAVVVALASTQKPTVMWLSLIPTTCVWAAPGTFSGPYWPLG